MSVFQMLKSFVLFVPFFVLAVYAGNLYDDIRTNDVPDTVPMRARLRAGQGIMAVFGSLGLLWNFFEFIPAAKYSSPSTFVLISFFDFLIGFFLLVSAGLQSTYLPHTIKGCKIADTWGENPQSNVTNLFRFAASVNGYSVEQSCGTYMTVYIMGMVLGTLSLICSYIAIRQARFPPFPQRHGTTRRPGIDVIGGFWSLIPRFITTPIRFCTRWLQKWCRQYLASRKINNTLEPKPISVLSLEEQCLAAPPLVARQLHSHKILELFSSYPIMTAIVSEMHYVDLVSLSMASRGVFQAIFPASNPAAVANIKRQSCVQGRKIGCWCCKKQTCVDPICANSNLLRRYTNYCSIPRVIRAATTTHHLRQCVPYCTACFRASSMLKAAGPRELSQHCSCRPSSNQYTQELCTTCNKLLSGEISLRVENTEKKDILDKAKHQLHCNNCRKTLPDSGPRWWGCTICRKECRSSFHPQWAERAVS